jgi:hypothetical protein
VYDNLQNEFLSRNYLINRVLLTTENESVDLMNKKVIEMFPGESVVYLSIDTVDEANQNQYANYFNA